MKKKTGYELKGGCKELEDLKGKEYDYLGHFRKKEYLKEGHNFMKNERASNILGAVSSGLSNIGGQMLKYGVLRGGTTPEAKVSTELETPKLGGEGGAAKRMFPKASWSDRLFPKPGFRTKF